VNIYKTRIRRCKEAMDAEVTLFSKPEELIAWADTFDILLNPSIEDATILLIGVSEAQLRFVTNTASGMGLIKCGSVVIPFDNQISKDTDLYRLYNTNIHEKIAEQKKKEAMLQ
jgi:hypothetical protein